MHELGVVINIVETVERFASQHGLTSISTLVLQIGELSSMIPKYVEACYPAAVDGTRLQDTKLVIEVLPANARCTDCGEVYRIMEHREACPACGGARRELQSGKEFLIKEIIAC